MLIFDNDENKKFTAVNNFSKTHNLSPLIFLPLVIFQNAFYFNLQVEG